MQRQAMSVDRRRLIGWFGYGGAALLAGSALPGRTAWGAAGTDALLLSCMDYRLTGATTQYMADRQMAGKYDHVILAGAALGAKTDQFPDWGRTFWQHLQVAIDLHHISKVVILDHRDCGAYKVILGKDLAANPQEELAAHAAPMRALRTDIAGKHPKLAVELLLMGLDGKVEVIA
jgi:carbonic anhydrase